MRRGSALVLASCLLVAGCGSNAATAERTTTAPLPGARQTATARTAAPTTSRSPAPEVLSGKVLVEAGDHFFSPQTITVSAGTTVTWKIVGQSAHDITAQDASFASSGLYFGDTFTRVFAKAGRFPYFCSLHLGDGMTGEIVVVAR